MARCAALFLAVLSTGCSSPGEAELQAGNRLASAGDLTLAIEAYRAACQKASQKARPRELLGGALHAAGRSTEARATWLEAVQLEPNNSSDAQLGLARIDVEGGDPAAALDRLDRLLQRDPRRADARLVRAQAYLKRAKEEDVARALEDTELALKGLPHDPDALYVRGSALLAARKLDEARAVFEGLKSARPALWAWGQARLAAAQSRNIDVIVHLRAAREAMDAGWVSARVREDPAFRYLWDDPEFSREFF
jgi:tetratricopeptide (TPR) repeat protein